jgi:hypothetical protein
LEGRMSRHIVMMPPRELHHICGLSFRICSRRRSLRTSSLIHLMFSCVLTFTGLPLRSSSLTLSRPFKNYFVQKINTCTRHCFLTETLFQHFINFRSNFFSTWSKI